MKIIEPSVEFFEETPTDYLEGLKLIERCGRTCYNSEDKITGGSAEPFVRKLVEREHLAMVEHSNLVIRARCEVEVSAQEFDTTDVGKFLTKHEDDKYFYVGGNWRAWVEYWGEADLDNFVRRIYEIEPYVVCPHDEIPNELRRYTAKLVCDRGVSHELVRHRPCSFAQRSTRYCDEGKDGMKFVEPWWMAKDALDDHFFEKSGLFKQACTQAEETYQDMSRAGAAPQAARAVLPNALATEIWVTADAAEWRWVKKLRTDKAAHPDIQRVMALVPWEKIL